MRKWIFLLAALLLLLSSILVIGGCGEKKYDLTISVSPSGGGTTVPTAGTHEYKKDEVVTITATPATGYQFVKWTGDASGTTATATVTMTQDKSVGANFSKIQYTLTIAKVGNGTTDPTVGAHTYDSGTAVSITATPDTGSHFVNWSGDATGTTATVSVTMSANKTVTANFALSIYTLTMAKVGNGTIVPDVGANTENAGAVVPLTATPDTGWRFGNWSGDASGTNASTSVTMGADKTVTATFIKVFTLTMAIDDPSHGTITPLAGASTHDTGTPVNLIADPETGWAFVNWTGDVTTVADVADPTTTVTMSGDYTITANFVALAQYTLTMAVDDTSHGTTTPVMGSNTVYEGVNPISATALAGWKFDHWSGDVSKVANVNAASTTITMDADYSITANFVALAQYTLTMAVDDPSHGTITDPAVSPSTHYEETVVNITATPAALWRFDHWSGDVGTVADVNDPTTTVTMNGNYTITANFVAITTPGENSYWVYNVDYVNAAHSIDSHTVWTLTVIDEVDAGTVLWPGTAAEYTLPDDCYLVDYSFSANPVRYSSVSLTFTDGKQWFSTDLLWERAKEMLSAYRTTVRHTYTGAPGSPLSDGKSWTDANHAITMMLSGTTSIDDRTTTYSVVVSSEQVTVPAGTFTCFKIVYSVGSNVAQTDWWSPEVLGLVKTVNYNYDGVAETWQLTSYSLL